MQLDHIKKLYFSILSSLSLCLINNFIPLSKCNKDFPQNGLDHLGHPKRFPKIELLTG